MLYEAVTDEQEQKFRNMGIHLQNMPQMLSDLLLRIVNEIAPRAFVPVLQDGINDGSIKSDNPDKLAEVISLVATVWLNPLVFTMSDEDLKNKSTMADTENFLLMFPLLIVSGGFDYKRLSHSVVFARITFSILTRTNIISSSEHL